MTPETFKRMRKELGWTQSALASALRVTPRAIRYYEAGQRAIPPPTALLLESVYDVCTKITA